MIDRRHRRSRGGSATSTPFKPRIPVSRVTTFAEGLDHPECVTFGPDGTVWAGGEAGQIYRIGRNGRPAVFTQIENGFIMGIAVAPKGDRMVACDLRNKCLWRIDLKSARHSKFADRAGPHRLSIPNHLCFTEDGQRLFVTDSGGFREVNGKILEFDTDGRGRVWHEGPFNFANGIAIDPDQASLVLCCTWLPGVERVTFRDDGSAGRRSVVAKLPGSLPDGLCFGARGELYVSCYAPSRIYRVARDGRVDVLADDPECHTLCNPTNISIARDGRTMLVANLGRWHIASIPLHSSRAR